MYSKEKQLLALILNCKVEELESKMNLSDEELNKLIIKLSCLKNENTKCKDNDIGRQSLRLNKLLNSY